MKQSVKMLGLVCLKGGKGPGRAAVEIPAVPPALQALALSGQVVSTLGLGNSFRARNFLSHSPVHPSPQHRTCHAGGTQTGSDLAGRMLGAKEGAS